MGGFPIDRGPDIYRITGRKLIESCNLGRVFKSSEGRIIDPFLNHGDRHNCQETSKAPPNQGASHSAAERVEPISVNDVETEKVSLSNPGTSE